LAGRRKPGIVGESAIGEAAGERRIGTREGVYDRADEGAAREAIPRLAWPGRPASRADEGAIGEAHAGAVAAVGDHADAGIVDELAVGEGDVANRLAFAFHVHSA